MCKSRGLCCIGDKDDAPYLDHNPDADYSTVETATFEHFGFDWVQIRYSSPNPTRDPRHAVQTVIAELVTQRQFGLI